MLVAVLVIPVALAFTTSADSVLVCGLAGGVERAPFAEVGLLLLAQDFLFCVCHLRTSAAEAALLKHKRRPSAPLRTRVPRLSFARAGSGRRSQFRGSTPTQAELGWGTRHLRSVSIRANPWSTSSPASSRLRRLRPC